MSPSKTRGLFIVLEGLDGAGTTTQTAAIASALRAKGQQVVTTREPSDGPIGTLIRQSLTGRLGLPHGRGRLTAPTLALMFAADRTDHVAAEIEPALHDGKLVISDRYLLSSLAYQGSEVAMGWVETINTWARQPDLTLMLTVNPKLAAQRRAGRGGEQELFEAEAFQKKTAKAYRAAIEKRRNAGETIVEIDGSLPIDAITGQCLEAIAKARPMPQTLPSNEAEG